MDQRHISLLHFAAGKLRRQLPMRLIVLCHHDQSAGFFVQPVHDSGAQLSPHGRQCGKMMQQRIPQRSAISQEGYYSYLMNAFVLVLPILIQRRKIFAVAAIVFLLPCGTGAAEVVRYVPVSRQVVEARLRKYTGDNKQREGTLKEMFTE